MHPIDYYVYRIFLKGGSLLGSPYYEIQKAMVGIAFTLFFPFLLILIAVVSKFPLLLGLIAQLPPFILIVSLFAFSILFVSLTMHVSSKYYSEEKLKELCVRYKDHKMNRYSYFLVSMFVVLASVLIFEFGSILLFVFFVI